MENSAALFEPSVALYSQDYQTPRAAATVRTKLLIIRGFAAYVFYSKNLISRITAFHNSIKQNIIFNKNQRFTAHISTALYLQYGQQAYA